MNTLFKLLEIEPTVEARLRKHHAFRIERTFPEKLADLASDPRPFDFDLLVSASLGFVADGHLGLIDPEGVVSYGKQGVQSAVRYFFEQWYGESCPEKLIRLPENRSLAWTNIFQRAFLIALLLRDEEGIARLADWPEAWMQLDLSDDDPLWGKILVSVAAAFRNSPMGGLADAEAVVLKSRSKGPKLNLQAWIAARSGDQKTFDKVLIESVLHFEKSMKSPHRTEEFLAIYPSLVLAAAREKGMAVPEMEPRLLARLITRESLGLDVAGIASVTGSVSPPAKPASGETSSATEAPKSSTPSGRKKKK